MRIESYVLNIYCDNKDLHSREAYDIVHPYSHSRIYDKSAGACRRAARRVGWRLSKEKDLCPSCHKAWKLARVESRKKKVAKGI